MFIVVVTRTNKRGITYAKGMVAGPYETQEEAEQIRDKLAATDGDPTKPQTYNVDSVWSVEPHEPCQACIEETEGGRASVEHTC